jgi:nucleoside phosphorylase
MRSELRPVVRAMSGRRATLAGSSVYIGAAGPTSVTVAMIGVGPDAASRSTEKLLDAAHFDHAVVCGIAGGIAPDIEVGDLMTPAAVEDLRSGRRFTPVPIGGHGQSGTIGTTHELILDEGRLAELVQRGVIGLDMETAAAAEVCEGRSLPWSVFRVVSDRPQDGLFEHGIMELLESDGTVNVRRAAMYVAARPSRVRPLSRLARDFGGAARRAARATVAACATL